jgi:hypothetical protein
VVLSYTDYLLSCMSSSAKLNVKYCKVVFSLGLSCILIRVKFHQLSNIVFVNGTYTIAIFF